MEKNTTLQNDDMTFIFTFYGGPFLETTMLHT